MKLARVFVVFGFVAAGGRNKERFERRQRKRLDKTPEDKVRKIQSLSQKWCAHFMRRQEHKERCEAKFASYGQKLENNYGLCGNEVESRKRREASDKEQSGEKEEDGLDMIEKMFEELDSSERLEASLILTRGIKPDTPLDKAPIILNKLTKAAKFFVNDHLGRCKKFIKLSRRIDGISSRFLDKRFLE